MASDSNSTTNIRNLRRLICVAFIPFVLSACNSMETAKQWAQTNGISITDQQAQSLVDNFAKRRECSDVPCMIRARWSGTGAEEKALRIARCESGFNPNAKNRRSSAFGVFQFLDSTWRSVGIVKTSNPELQIEAAFRLWKQRGWQPWVCKG